MTKTCTNCKKTEYDDCDLGITKYPCSHYLCIYCVDCDILPSQRTVSFCGFCKKNISKFIRRRDNDDVCGKEMKYICLYRHCPCYKNELISTEMAIFKVCLDCFFVILDKKKNRAARKIQNWFFKLDIYKQFKKCESDCCPSQVGQHL